MSEPDINTGNLHGRGFGRANLNHERQFDKNLIKLLLHMSM